MGGRGEEEGDEGTEREEVGDGAGGVRRRVAVAKRSRGRSARR